MLSVSSPDMIVGIKDDVGATITITEPRCHFTVIARNDPTPSGEGFTPSVVGMQMVGRLFTSPNQQILANWVVTVQKVNSDTGEAFAEYEVRTGHPIISAWRQEHYTSIERIKYVRPDPPGPSLVPTIWIVDHYGEDVAIGGDHKQYQVVVGQTIGGEGPYVFFNDAPGNGFRIYPPYNAVDVAYFDNPGDHSSHGIQAFAGRTLVPGMDWEWSMSMDFSLTDSTGRYRLSSNPVWMTDDTGAQVFAAPYIVL